MLPCADHGAERLRLDLLGCMAGALPYVLKHRIGALEVAHASALLLDGVDALPPEIQVALADAAESGRFRRIGAETSMPLNVRFLAVARDDPRRTPGLDQRFAEWLGCFTIVLPPLRERLEDLPTLIDQVLRQIEARASGPRRGLDPSAFRLLAGHGWPGNLRELASVLERASLACAGDTITEAHLPPLTAGRASLANFRSEMDWILHGLRENRFRRGRAAAYLGISRKTLYNKMRAYGLLSPERAPRG